jgi:hypothetical protein
MPTADLHRAASALADGLNRPSICDPAQRQALSTGAVGVALLHAERAAGGHTDPAILHRWLAAATAGGVDTGPNASPFYGVPAVAAALYGATGYRPARVRAAAGVAQVVRRRLGTAHTRIDGHRRPRLNEFDVIGGLAGFGTHLLRTDPAGGLLREVLAYLVRLTLPQYDGHPGWWSDQKLSGHRRSPPGHSNHGMAHGIAGPLAVLSLAAQRDITVPGHLRAIHRICTWLDTWQQPHPHGPWWPEVVTEDDLHTDTPTQRAPGRPSWCYGTPGIARAQQLAGAALRDPERQQLALDALYGCLTDPRQRSLLTDPGLCHGLAGLVQITWRMTTGSTLPAPATRLNSLADQLAVAPPTREFGLLDGQAGLALVQTAVATDAVLTAWDSVLAIA